MIYMLHIHEYISIVIAKASRISACSLQIVCISLHFNPWYISMTDFLLYIFKFNIIYGQFVVVLIKLLVGVSVWYPFDWLRNFGIVEKLTVVCPQLTGRWPSRRSSFRQEVKSTFSTMVIGGASMDKKLSKEIHIQGNI